MAGSKNSSYTQSVRLPIAYKPPLDWLIEHGYYPNRSDVIRTALRDLLRIEAPQAFYKADRKIPKQEVHRTPTTIFLKPEILYETQNLINELPQHKNLSDVINKALRWYFKYLAEGARIWENMIKGDNGFEAIKNIQELRNR